MVVDGIKHSESGSGSVDMAWIKASGCCGADKVCEPAACGSPVVCAADQKLDTAKFCAGDTCKAGDKDRCCALTKKARDHCGGALRCLRCSRSV